MSKDQFGYPCEPRNIDDTAWYYETRRGVEFVCEWRAADGALVGRKYFIIPWRRVLAAAETRKKAMARK